MNHVQLTVKIHYTKRGRKKIEKTFSVPIEIPWQGTTTTTTTTAGRAAKSTTKVTRTFHAQI